MERLILSLSIFITCTPTQLHWQSVKADSNLTIKMPGEVSNSVYKNQKIISSYSDSVNLHLSFEENRIKLHFQDKKELLEGYDNFIIGYLRSFKNPKVHMTKELTMDGLVAKKVEFQADINETRKNIFAAFVIIDNKTYLFQIITQYSLKETKTLKKFLDGVDFKNSLTKDHQLD